MILYKLIALLHTIGFKKTARRLAIKYYPVVPEQAVFAGQVWDVSVLALAVATGDYHWDEECVQCELEHTPRRR